MTGPQTEPDLPTPTQGPVDPDPVGQHPANPAAPAPVTEKIVERPSPLTGLARGGIALVAAAWFLTREILEGEELGGSVVIIGVVLGIYAIIAGVSGVLTWRMTTFIADDEEFRIERRLLSQTSTRIDYTKVQSVDINQPIVARLLGLAKVHIDVGGAGGADLVYLSLARAESLRDHLIARMRGARRGLPTPPDATQITTPAENPARVLESTEDVVVARVGPRNLLIGAFVSSNTAVWVVIAAAVLIVGLVAGEPITAIPALLAVGGWVWSQTGKNWGFVMTRRGETLHISRGALNKAAQGLHPRRIQGLQVRQDILHRPFGLYSVSVTVLGYGDVGDENEGSNALILPYGTAEDVAAVLHAIWPDVDLDSIQPQPQPARARWLTPVTFRSHTWGFDDKVIVAQHGLLTQTRTIVPHRRMQSAGLRQGPLERWLRVATVAIHTTDGPVDLRLYHLDAQVARQVMLEQVRLARLARTAADR
ncbi:PH domain-containing protein [Tessaracoccus lacteus]|uniref:PH domain-containing protein n=1 Tax=Tessaracoccus lacteus TaxID=3041766 RepID=A0ABY8PYG9_9ACTN|nr:PH domain-containing protein [Tessaracoccus sp. T21]WGT47550.1 PH domain-containing protein [Tessaracoccus sp. T21]